MSSQRAGGRGRQEAAGRGRGPTRARAQVQEELQALGEKGERYEDGYIRKDRPGAGAGGALDSEIGAEEVRRPQPAYLPARLPARAGR